MDKTLYCIRHGYALHNKLFWSLGKRAYQEFRDTPLIEHGYYQAKNLNKKWIEIDDIELDKSSLEVPKLHAKYSDELTSKVLLLKKYNKIGS